MTHPTTSIHTCDNPKLETWFAHKLRAWPERWVNSLLSTTLQHFPPVFTC